MEDNDRCWNKLLTLVVVVIILPTECVAKYSVTVLNAEKYALNGQNATFLYTITADSAEKTSEPDIIKLKIMIDKDTYSVLYKIILERGNLTIGMQNIGTTKSLFRFKGRVAIEYKKPNIKFHLAEITDADFMRNYQVEVKNQEEDDRYQKDIKLIKAEKPTIMETSIFPEQMMNRGSDNEFICRADGVPKPTVKWMNGGVLLDEGYGKSSLTIKDAQIKDTGNYDCIAENIGGITKNTLSLTVAYIEYGIENYQATSKRIYVRNDGEIEEECNVDGYPEAEYKWRDPSKNIIRSTRLLYIGNVNKQFGNYTCEAVNEVDKTLIYTVEVIEKRELPTISDTAFFPQKTILHGSNEEYVCSASGSPPPQVKWLTKGEIVNSRVLAFLDVQKNDAGDYTCVAENDVGVVNRTMTLIVSYLEYTDGDISRESINITSGDGGQVGVLCKVGGIPTPSYKWFDPSGDVVASSQQLNVSDVEVKDGGKYRCEADNGASSTLNYDVLFNVEALTTTPPTTTPTTTPTTSQPTSVKTNTPQTKVTTVEVTNPIPEPESKPEPTVVTSPRLNVVVADSDSRRSGTSTSTNKFPCFLFFPVYIVYILF